MTQEELKKIFEDKAFMKELFTKETPEDAQACFASKGIELTLQQVEEVGDILAKVASGEMTVEELNDKAKGELSEDDLEEVAGGIVVTATGMAIATAIVAVAGGAAGFSGYYFADEIGSGISSAAKEVYNFFRSW